MSEEKRKKELVKVTAILSVGKMCTQGVNFFLLPLYTSILTQQETGIVDLLNSYITLLLPLANWQFDMGIYRFLIEKREDREAQRKLFSSTAVMNILQIVIYTAVFVFVQRYIHTEYKWYLLVDVVIKIILNLELQFSRGIGKNGIYSFASFLCASLTVALNVIFIATLRLGAQGLIYGTVVSEGITLIFLFFATKSWKFFSLKLFDKKIIKSISRYSFPLIPTQLSWWVIGVSDRTVVSQVLGVSANGVYSVANKFSNLYITVYNIFNMSWTETMSLHINDEDRDEFFTALVNTIFGIFASLCLLIIAVMPIVFPLLVNKEYAEGYMQVPILMTAVLFQCICGLYSAVYIAIKKSKESAKTAFYAAVINIIIDVCLVSSIGLYAASLSTLVAFVVMAIYRYFDSKKYIKMVINTCKLVITLAVLVFDVWSIMGPMRSNWIFIVVNIMVVLIYSIWINKSFLHSSIKEIRQIITKYIESK